MPNGTIAAPGTNQVSVPPYQSPFLSPEDIQYNEMVKRMRDVPVLQAERAINAALRFQGQRGYQRDLQAGMAPAEALMKWGPTMFGSTAGTAGALGRLAKPAAEKYMDIGGVGYQMIGGKAIPLTQPKAKTIPLQLPADPQNPMSGGHITVPLDANDPLVTKALERARQGTPAEEVKPPGFWERLGNRILPPSNAPGVAPTQEPAARTNAPVRTPQQKLDAARELRRQHPDWTKQQILNAVNQ